MVDDFEELLDRLYQAAAKTTGGDKQYWDYQEYGDTFDVDAVGQDGERDNVAAFFSEADADFVTMVHAAIPELIRGTREALDEAERADRQRDERECRIAELEIEVAALRKELLTA